jgi:hypothetical protein
MWAYCRFGIGKNGVLPEIVVVDDNPGRNARMAQFIRTDASAATATDDYDHFDSLVDEAWTWLRPPLVQLVRRLCAEPLTPQRFWEFEISLFILLRGFGRQLLELLLNGLEGDGTSLPRNVTYRGQGYRRLNKKTRNRHVATLFGTISLLRFPYRFWHEFVPEPCIFPLEMQLGLVEHATPALADYIGRRMAEAGATQNRVLQQLKEEHGVSMGVGRLRDLVAAISAAMSEHRQETQVEALLAALKTAAASRGNRKPVLAVGRDGITLCEYQHRFWEVATTATVTVFDRAGKRLTTVFLAWSPELGQTTMSQMLTDLLTDVLKQWEGPLPTLAYVADAGDNESGYFKDTLARMLHPRTGERLCWERVVDFYHAAERVWTMAEALFGKDTPQYHQWAKRMLSILKNKPRGAKRVLHSAAAYAARMKMSKTQRQSFRRACNYIRTRTPWMRYRDYKQRHIPLGSGITEAACKTVFTQRLKLSGMRWKRSGCQRILMLRTILLSGTWEPTYMKTLETRTSSLPRPYERDASNSYHKAA